jgi:GT2 family glycosyltransferase
VVADNASTDDSISFLQQYFPQIERLLLSQNFGFAKGYNEALRHISADYYVLLNSDVEVTAGWLSPIIELLESNKNAAACQPKILSYQDKTLFEYAGAAGGWMDSFGYPFARGRVFDVSEKYDGQYETEEKVFWATGAALVVRSHCFHEASGFDEYFFAHMEEIDLCWRLQLLGYTIFCYPASTVYHVGGGTLPKGNSRKVFLNFRNNQIMIARNLPWSQKWWKVPVRLALDQVAAVKSLLSGDIGYFAAVIKAQFAFFYWAIFDQDKRFKPKQRKRLEELDGVYQGSIVWQYFVKGKKRFSQIVRDDAEKQI